MKYDNILQSIGNTPHIRINRLFRDDIEVWMKTESFNPCSSIKDRIALAMVEDAETKGLLNVDTIIIEPTSGNTGIGLALVAAVKGYLTAANGVNSHTCRIGGVLHGEPYLDVHRHATELFRLDPQKAEFIVLQPRDVIAWADMDVFWIEFLSIYLSCV